jgi:heme/copper-type cytochrome/quinol oxidase subunit 2
MFLINWLESNIMMAITTLVFIGIPAVILIIVFSKRNPEEENNAEM